MQTFTNSAGQVFFFPPLDFFTTHTGVEQKSATEPFVILRIGKYDSFLAPYLEDHPT